MVNDIKDVFQLCPIADVAKYTFHIERKKVGHGYEWHAIVPENDSLNCVSKKSKLNAIQQVKTKILNNCFDMKSLEELWEKN